MAAPSATPGIAVLGAASRSHGGSSARLARHAGRRLRGRFAGWGHREDGRARRLPLRPRRPPVLHEGAVGAGDVGGDAGGRVPAPPAALAHLLPRRLLRLSAPRRGRRPPPRRRRDDPLPRLLHGGEDAPRRAAADVRGVGHGPLRPPPLRRILPRVHREGVGDSRQRDPGRVGGPADPQPVVLDRADLRAAPQAART